VVLNFQLREQILQVKIEGQESGKLLRLRLMLELTVEQARDLKT
jgi:hypothetical protein